MHQSVNGLDLASNVEVLSSVIQILDSGVLFITSKDLLSLLLSGRELALQSDASCYWYLTCPACKHPQL